MEGLILFLLFFKEINSDGSFHVPELYHLDLLHRLPYKELFIFQGLRVSTPLIVFLIQGHSGKPIFSLFINIFFY